jgi:hypothetical protein
MSNFDGYVPDGARPLGYVDPTGAPISSPDPIEVPRGHAVYGSARKIARRLVLEGPRGRSTRNAVWLRYLSYFLTIVLAAGITQACFASVQGAQSGGQWLLLSASFQLAVAAIGSFMFSNRRAEIIRQVRSYVFGYTVFPGAGLAIFMWSARHLTAGASANDIFVNTLNNALPWIYFLPVVLPAVIFLKTVAGMRSLRREQLSDQELMRTYKRQDSSQR